MWKCACDCGTIKEVPSEVLLNGSSTSCGCINKERMSILGKANGGKHIKIAQELFTKFRNPYEGALNDLYGSYKRNAKNRRLSFEISFEKFCKLLVIKCSYCGALPNIKRSYRGISILYNGLDRIDNSRGYTEDNVTPCCFSCNHAKNTVTRDEYLSLSNKIYNWCISKNISTVNENSSTTENGYTVVRCTLNDPPAKTKYIKFRDPYEGSLHKIYHSYKSNSKIKNRKFTLTFRVFCNMISSDCTYCGGAPNTVLKYRGVKIYYNGIDRIDSSKGYTNDNVCPCCYKCNLAKSYLCKEDFLNLMKKVYLHNSQNVKIPTFINNRITDGNLPIIVQGDPLEAFLRPLEAV
jgi:hypothetical protein